MELLGLIAIVTGCLLVNTALGVLAGGAAALITGYLLEDAKK
jgi:hypothetical protein